MFMLSRLNCNNLISNRVASPDRIRKPLISLTRHPGAVFTIASRSGKFFDTWSNHRHLGGQV
jgi:hypothetical protein